MGESTINRVFWLRKSRAVYFQQDKRAVKNLLAFRRCTHRFYTVVIYFREQQIAALANAAAEDYQIGIDHS